MRLVEVLTIAFLLATSFGPETFATEKHSACVPLIQEKLHSLESSPGHVTQGTFDPRVRNWLKLRAQELATRAQTGKRMRKKVGDLFKFKGESLRVVALLGDGSEGEVYLVQTAQGLRTAKVFFDPSVMEASLKAALRYSREVPMPKLERGDLNTRTVIMEYIEGIPVKEIKLHGEAIGFKKKEAAEILKRFERDIKGMTPPGQNHPPEDFNVVYSPKTQRFYLIDPF